jgi:hypothetical protein
VKAFPCFVGLLCLIVAANLPGEVVRYDTTQPNEFYFTSDVYYVAENATNAVIEVGFVAGNRSYTGSVDYHTENGSAIAGADYGGVTNTLSFSGLAPTKTFTIPIILDGLLETNETVQLFLSNSNALITHPTAKLVIIDKTAIPFQLGTSNGYTTISWPALQTNVDLQLATNLASTNWSSVPFVGPRNGRYYRTGSASGAGFFRLRVLP